VPLEARHLLLVEGADRQTAVGLVRRFFARTPLVQYEQIELPDAGTLAGHEPAFQERLTAGLTGNQQVLAGLLVELAEEGVSRLADLQDLGQGYHSKLLHTVAHLLDGFFGIDSHFYNLAEDSHRISDACRTRIAAAPGSFWLVEVIGRSQTPGEDDFARLRKFERDPAEKEDPQIQ